MRFRSSRAAGRQSRWIAAAVVLSLTVSSAAAGAAAQDGAVQPADPMAAHVPVPHANYLSDLPLAVPADPYAAARALVDLTFDANPATGSAAVTEILRRSGIPVVSPDGPVLALPDDIVLVNAAMYDGSVADLARSVRKGDGWALIEFTDALKGSDVPEKQDGFGAIAEFVEPSQIAAAMGDLGRGADNPPEVRFAGAVLRALSGRRGEILSLSAKDEQLVDPLQWLLLLSLWTSDADHNLEAATGRVATGRLASAALTADDPCGDLARALKEGGAPATADKDLAKEIVKGEIKRFVPRELGNPVGKGFDVWDKGTSVLSLLILLLGMDLEFNTDKTSTHFKHRGGDRGPHVKLSAIAKFDSALAQNRLGCYSLAGIEVRPNGPQAGFRVVWDLDQPIGSYSRFGSGPNPFPLFQQGMLLAPISADSNKIGALVGGLPSRGGAGQLTTGNGLSTLELYPPVEKHPGQGAELYGNVHVKAILTIDDMPRLLKVTDPISIVKEAQGGVPIVWAIKKTIDLALSYLKRAGLPKKSTTIRVGYHGPDVYVVKGSGTAWLFFYQSPFAIDLYVCDGLSVSGNAQGQTTGGRWRGTAKFGNERFIDPQVINGILREAARLFRAPISVLPALPEQVNFENPNVDQVVNPLLDPSVGDQIHLVSPQLEGWIMITNPPPQTVLNGPSGTVLTSQHVNGSVGTIELFLGPSSLDELGNIFDGLWSAKFTITGVPQDPRCPGGPDDYYFRASECGTQQCPCWPRLSSSWPWRARASRFRRPLLRPARQRQPQLSHHRRPRRRLR